MRILLLAALLVAPAVSAQVSLGVRAGYGGARYTIPDGERVPSTFRPGYSVGVFADVPAYRGLSVRPELQYVQKGDRAYSSSLSFDEGRFEREETVRQLEVNYVEIPVLARVSSPAGGRFQVAAVAGPSLAVRVDERARLGRYVNGTSDPYPPGSIVIAADFARFDVGAIVGGEVTYGRFGLDARYTVGLTEAESFRSVRNEAASVALSYRVGL